VPDGSCYRLRAGLVPADEVESTCPRIRLATVAEAELAARILEETAQWCESRGVRAWSQGEFSNPSGRGRRQLGADQAGGSLYLVWLDGIAVGTFSLLMRDQRFWPMAPDDALYLHRFGVRLHAWGIGRAAIRWMSAEARRRSRGYLRLDCLAENAAICRYYERAGFVSRGEMVIEGIRFAL